jgi:transposase
MARKSKLTPETQDKIVKAIRAGNYAHIAAAMAGIGESTYYRWLEQGERPDAKTPYREFWESVKEAEAEAEVASVALIRRAAQNGTWQASAWYLERKHSERWGRKDKVQQEISGRDGEPIKVEDTRQIVMDLIEQIAPREEEE